MVKLLAVILLLQHWQPFVDGWSQFCGAHMKADGRVVDDYNGTTHSEAQSYTMLLATAAGDRVTFDLAWNWTTTHLRRPDDLFAWQWKDGQVQDDNDASDADIVLAWALLRAADIWSNQAYRDAALPIIAAIRRDLVVMQPVPAGALGANSDDRGQLPVLLPGKVGFVTRTGSTTGSGATPGKVTLNLSYWIYPALAAFALADPGSDAATFWRQLAASGRRLTDLAAAGNPAGLPPDWLDLASLQPAADHDPRASYDALRIPLWQIWAAESPSAGAAWQRLWREQNKAWVDLTTQGTADYAPGLEQHAVLRLIDLSTRADWQGQPSRDLPSIASDNSYFASAIALLSLTAEAERRVDAAR